MLRMPTQVGHGDDEAPEHFDSELLHRPNVRLYGPIDDALVRDCLKQIQAARDASEPLVMELTTEGGDAEGGRRIALEVRLYREWHKQETYFVGKTAVMSAGVTIMAAFPKACRFLTPDTELLIHERRLQKTLSLDGPIRANIQIVREMLSQLESAERIEKDGFSELVKGSRITLDELYRRSITCLYLPAAEALKLELIAGVV